MHSVKVVYQNPFINVLFDLQNCGDYRVFPLSILVNSAVIHVKNKVKLCVTYKLHESFTLMTRKMERTKIVAFTDKKMFWFTFSIIFEIILCFLWRSLGDISIHPQFI